MKSKNIFEKLFPYNPAHVTCYTVHFFLSSGVTIGAGFSLAQLNDTLHSIVSEQPQEKTKTYRALLKHLRTLAGPQIRNMAVCLPV